MATVANSQLYKVRIRAARLRTDKRRKSESEKVSESTHSKSICHFAPYCAPNCEGQTVCESEGEEDYEAET